MDKKTFKTSLKESIKAMRKVLKEEGEVVDDPTQLENGELQAGSNEAEPMTTESDMSGAGKADSAEDANLSVEEIEKKIEIATEELDDEIEKEKLSESFKAKIHNLIKLKEDAMIADLEDKFDDYKQEYEEDLLDKEDEYLENVVDEFLDQNKVAVKESIKTRIVEGFIEDMKALLTKYNINIPEDEVSKAEEYAEECDELKQELNDTIVESIRLKRALKESKKQVLVERALRMAKLAESEERKLRRLAEDVDYVDDEQFMKDFDKKVDEVSEDDEEIIDEVPAGDVDAVPSSDEEEVLSLEEAIKNARAAIK
jgi:hypothetical protein